MTEKIPKNVYITLTIDSDQLYNGYPSTPPADPAWISLVSLSDNNKGSNKGSNAGTFESKVNPGSVVVWDASQSNQNNSKYKVSINQIYNSPIGTSPIIFSDASYIGASGKVKATVLSSASTSVPGPNESYAISFSVEPKPNGTIKYYWFDPKIKVDPT